MTFPNQAGNARKQAAHVLLEARREQYICAARRVLLLRLLEHGTATIDDVRDAIELPTGIDPKCFGAVPGHLARAGIIRRVGFATTTRAIAHARPVTVWQLVDARRAQAWLASHRPLPDLTTGAQLALPLVDAGASETGDVVSVAR
ncbi:MAG: hypothetical protein GXP26_14240 [Planctomycetes bacterium]|nr:hypothetical protein [Planctomycetota bacterium]